MPAGIAADDCRTPDNRRRNRVKLPGHSDDGARGNAHCDRKARGPGRVILVGAGPGDPELLTLRAVRALQEAEVVLHDDLIDTAILEHTRPGTRRVAVGKRGGCPSTPQAFIEQLLIREARAGHVVVRLKGGDPFVFGRGGEELTALRAAGIRVEIVPGITAGLAAPALFGIPVTHRNHAHGVALVTGHGARDDPGAEGAGDGPDWQALVASRLTLVVYMGLARIDVIRATLLAAGMSGDMPVAILANASRPMQAGLTATVDTMAVAARNAGTASPAILVIGRMAAWAQVDGGTAHRAAADCLRVEAEGLRVEAGYARSDGVTRDRAG
jgi:uroporphyrin-III C-methyltransferase